MLKLVILIIYFAVLIGIGLYCRKHATDVNGFVLGGRSVGPWLTAFAYGTSYFSAVRPRSLLLSNIAALLRITLNATYSSPAYMTNNIGR